MWCSLGSELSQTEGHHAKGGELPKRGIDRNMGKWNKRQQRSYTEDFMEDLADKM